MRKLILILTILTLSLSCSEDGIGGESIALYDFTANVETTIDDIRTDTGKIIHARKTTKVLSEYFGIDLGKLNSLKINNPERVEVVNVVHDGNLTVRTTSKYFNEIKYK